MQDKTPGVSTLLITCSRDCPSVEPISEPLRDGSRVFSMAEAAIVAAAIDADMFYNDDVEAFCRPAWEQANPAIDACLTRSEHGDYVMARATFAERKEDREALEATLRSSPRGTWGMFREDWQHSDGHSGTSWGLYMADGRGGVHNAQTSHIWHNEKRVPTYKDAIASLVGYEIYLATSAERKRREKARSRLIIRTRGWAVGTKLRNLRIGGGRYSSGIIETISEHGGVRLQLRKRGSRNTWSWVGLAQSIQAEGLSEELPAYGQTIVKAA